MKTYHKKTLTRKAGFTFFRNWEEEIAICNEFINFALNQSVDEFRDCSVKIDVRVKNPKEKGFIRIFNSENHLNAIVFAARNKTRKRFSLCLTEFLFLKHALKSPKVFWVRVREIS